MARMVTDMTGRNGKYRWIIVVLLLVATTINYLDRQIIGLLKPILEKEFSWTETDFARIVMAFTAAYAVGLLISGRIIDKIGTRLGYSITVIVWSIFGMLHALARGVAGFAAVRIGLGLGEAGNFPAAVKVVAEWFPRKERALATGIFNAGTSVGVVTALLIVPLILNYFGWHEVFWITGALGLIWVIVWWLFYEIPSRHKWITASERSYIEEDETPDQHSIARMSSRPVSIRWQRLFSFPQTWAFVAGKAFIDPIYWFFLFWLPSYFAANFSLDLKKPNLQLMTIYAATTIGSIGGGYLSSLLVRRGWDVVKARKASLLLFAFLEVSIILAQFAGGPWIAVGLISLAVAVHQAWATNIFTLASDLFPKEAVSSVVGIGGMAGAVGGILFPMFVGYLLDSYKAGGNLVAGYNVLFTLCGFTYLITWLIIHLLTRNRSKVPLDLIS
ncbi:MFS transporter [Chryseolinea sp. T2]|uniref:MFS transporter n=1 Tax=Chryseolinea sp. T2 TaxID=3129255 RepID=UPI0030772F1C